jgi:hypothetical protein
VFDQWALSVDERPPAGRLLTNGILAVTNRLRPLAERPFFALLRRASFCMASKRKLTTFFFWTLLFVALLLQLATTKQVSFRAAFLYTLSMLATFRLYFHFASRPATQRFVARRSTLAALLLLACATLALALALQAYILIQVETRNSACLLRTVLYSALPDKADLLPYATIFWLGVPSTFAVHLAR